MTEQVVSGPGVPNGTPQDPDTLTTKKKMSTGKKVALVLSAVVVVLLAAAYVVGGVFFSTHFYPNTKFNAKDVSFQSDNEFVSEVEAIVPYYVLTITGEDYIQEISADQVNLKVDPKQLKRDAFEAQQAWSWPIKIFGDHDVSDMIEASFDQGKVQKLLAPSVEEHNKVAEPSVDAMIAYDQKRDTLVVQEEFYGNVIDLPVFIERVDECLAGMQSALHIDSSVCVQPVILSTDERFKAALPAAQDLINGEIELTMAEGSVSAGKVGKDLLVTWLTLDPETLMPTLDQELVTTWADKKGIELNTVGTKRTFLRGDGQTVDVSGGVYGWKVNTADLASTLIGNVTAGNFATIDIPCEQTADVYNGAGERDWGAYVDVDISEQKVRYFNENNEMLYETNCVTGDATRGRSTPTGIYYLRAKKSPEILTGLNADGSKDYETHVTYWMPFIRNSIGLHDASWRGRFGGTIYRGNGSHGCVNLPTDAAKWFYENLTTNTAVLVHD